MSQTIIQIEHVSKEYRLGAIGGGTLQGDLQSWWSRLRKKEDPNIRLDKKQYNGHERFLALHDVSFSVSKGEALGIIGHNGAGKSTLLKLLSRVTAPTEGKISYNGRIASMLEVGTGFHPELTGRENIYMNGAILGMRKSEIDKKLDAIIDFSGMEKFIDTPVKRYSSGMYVKLAFSVAAHLDSEILVMDEVLAVGDVQFQQKCLGRMGDVSEEEGKTILYVSHNMNTVRKLCKNCVVLNHGEVEYIGDTESAIAIYLQKAENKSVFSDFRQRLDTIVKPVRFLWFEIIGRKEPVFSVDETIKASIGIESQSEQRSLKMRMEIYNGENTIVGTMISAQSFALHGKKEIEITMDLHRLMPSTYKVTLLLFQSNSFGSQSYIDRIPEAFSFSIEEQKETDLTWLPRFWGNVRLEDIQIMDRGCK